MLLLAQLHIKQGRLSFPYDMVIIYGNLWTGNTISFRALQCGRNSTNNEVIERVHNNQIKLGFIVGSCYYPTIVLEEVCHDEMVLVVPETHPWAEKNDVDPDEILTDKFILREPGSGSREIIEHKFQDIGINLNRYNFFLEYGSTEAIKIAIESGIGYSILSVNAVKKELGAGYLVKVGIRGMKFTRTINAIYKNFITFFRETSQSVINKNVP